MGAQLDRLRFGIHLSPDPYRQRSEVEDQLLQQAVLIRCIDEFTRREEFSVTTRQRSAAEGGYRALTRIQDKATIHRPQGSIAVGILRAFQERSRGSQECGLVAVYNYVQSIAPSVVPPPPKGDEDLLQAFRTGHAARARKFVCEAHADSLLALQDHVRVFNKRERKKDEKVAGAV